MPWRAPTAVMQPWSAWMRPPHPRRAPSCTRGARGVRFAFNPQHGGSLDLTVFNHVVRCIAPLGWFVELHFDGADIARLQEWLEAIPVQVVIDHLGRVDPGGVAQEPFQILLALLARQLLDQAQRRRPHLAAGGAVCRCSAVGAGAGERPSRPLVVGNRLAAHGLLRCRQGAGDTALVDALATFVPEAPEREAILVHNPLRLLALAA